MKGDASKPVIMKKYEDGDFARLSEAIIKPAIERRYEPVTIMPNRRRAIIRFPEVLVISHSRLRKWRRCKKLHDYRYNQKLRPRRKGIPLLKGSVIDACIGAHNHGRPWRVELEKFRKEFNRLFAEERATLGDLPAMIEKIVTNYIETYKTDGLSYPPRRGRRRSQLPVRVWLDDRTLFIGYIDAYPKDRRGLNWLMDHKAPKNIPDEDARFSDVQFAFYVWALEKSGYPKPDGIIWDYVRSMIPKKKGRGDQLYRVRLPNPKREMIDQLVADMRVTAEEIRREGKTNTVRTMDWTCRNCEYYSLCQAELRGLDSDFIRKKEFVTKGEEHGDEKEGADGRDDA